jgi:hypothetical protein
MLGLPRGSWLAVFVAACGFNSGGVPGSNQTAATIGSNDTSTGADSNDDDASASTSASTTSNPGTSATTLPDSDSNTTTSPTTTATTDPTTDTDGTTGSVVTDTSDDTTNGSVDSTPPLETGEESTSSAGTTTNAETGEPPPPYYANCDDATDCGAGGDCFMTPVQNAPDAHVCLVPCNPGCPPPDDAVAMEVCTSGNWCMLSCNDDPDCPDGMECYTFNFGQQNEFRRCLWPQG